MPPRKSSKAKRKSVVSKIDAAVTKAGKKKLDRAGKSITEGKRQK
jgi:hypothetical protein